MHSFRVQYLAQIKTRTTPYILRAFSIIGTMGVSSQRSLVPVSYKDLVEGADEVQTKNSSSCGYLQRKVMESQRAMMMSKKSDKSRRRRGRIAVKRRARLVESSRRRANKIERRVTKLKRLIPNGESVGLDGLFRKTAHYILTLQMRVRVMQIMAKVLTDSDR